MVFIQTNVVLQRSFQSIYFTMLYGFITFSSLFLFDKIVQKVLKSSLQILNKYGEILYAICLFQGLPSHRVA